MVCAALAAAKWSSSKISKLLHLGISQRFFAELSISGENGAMSELFQHSRSLYTGRVVLDQQ